MLKYRALRWAFDALIRSIAELQRLNGKTDLGLAAAQANCLFHVAGVPVPGVGVDE